MIIERVEEITINGMKKLRITKEDPTKPDKGFWLAGKIVPRGKA